MEQTQHIVIRDATKEDANALVLYMKQVIQETENLSMEPDEFTLTEEQEASFIDRMNRSNHDSLKLAIMNNQIVSTASFHGTDRRRLTHRVELGISVLKQYHNQGIGRVMMNALITEAKALGKTTIELEVRADNKAAIYLYKSLGFEEEGRKKQRFHVKDGYVDTVLMALYMEDNK